MTVDDYAEALCSVTLEFVSEGYYRNQLGQVGYRAIYKEMSRYLWFSVSGTEERFAPDEVATAIVARQRFVQRANAYFNRNGQAGFEATVLSGGRAYMLNAAPDAPRHCRG